MRPSNISGKPVTSLIDVTGIPAAARVAAVPPVETISKPNSVRAVANSTRPLLSETLNSALRGMLLASLIVSVPLPGARKAPGFHAMFRAGAQARDFDLDAHFPRVIPVNASRVH